LHEGKSQTRLGKIAVSISAIISLLPGNPS
jgi:hypothetical protein